MELANRVQTPAATVWALYHWLAINNYNKVQFTDTKRKEPVESHDHLHP